MSETPSQQKMWYLNTSSAPSQQKTFHLITSSGGMSYDTANERCRARGMRLAQIESDEERAALNAFDMQVPRDSTWQSYPAWVAGRLPKGSRTWVGASSWLQGKFDSSFCDPWFEGCCPENGDDSVCAFVYFSGKDKRVEDYVTGCARSDRRFNVLDHGCGTHWFKAAICQSGSGAGLFVHN